MKNAIILKLFGSMYPETCDKCEERVKKVTEYEKEKYCQKCLLKEFIICDRCNEVSKERFSHPFYDGKVYCKECKEESIPCKECQLEYFEEDIFERRGEKYCLKCTQRICPGFKIIQFTNTKVTSGKNKKNKSKRYCGVEIECLNKNKQENAFTRQELDEYQFNQIEDGSLSSSKGFEFYSQPMNGDKLYEKITDFCKELEKRNFYVNRDCGLHIHLEVPKNDLELIKKIYLFYGKYEPYFFEMLPPSRQQNSFCYKYKKAYSCKKEEVEKAETMEEIQELLYNTEGPEYYMRHQKAEGHRMRYCWINLHSIFYRGTIEVRSHSGTINQNKIINWFRIHERALKIIEKLTIKQIIELEDSKQALLGLYDKELRKYIRARMQTFNGPKAKPSYNEEDLKIIVRRQGKNVRNTYMLQTQ